MSRNPDSSVRLASTLESLTDLSDARRWYMAHPDHFALGDPEERYEAVLGPDVMFRAAKQAVVTFGVKPLAFLEDFCDVTVPDIIARAGRGCGKTFMSALGQAVLAWSLPMFTCTVTAGSFEQARRNYRYWMAFAESPRMRVAHGGPLLDDPMQRGETRFRNDGWLLVLHASEKSVKGEHPMMVVVDEATSAEERILDLVEGQLSGGPAPYGAEVALNRVMSTGDELHHSFVDAWDNRREKYDAWHTWGMRDCPWNTEAKIRRLERRHSKNWCRIHIEGKFGSATGMVFERDYVLASAIPSLQTDPWGVWQHAERRPQAITGGALGVDWGHVHKTVLLVAEEVDVEAGRRPQLKVPPEQVWPLVYVTAIEGYQETDITDIWERMASIADGHRVNAWMDAEAKGENEHMKLVLRKIGLRGTAVSFRYRGGMIDIANALLERGRLRIPQAVNRMPGEDRDEGQLLLNQMLRYSWAEKGVREKVVKKDDDYVDALLLALWGLYGSTKRPPRKSRVRSHPR